jgi:hypothetical protein
MSERTGVLQLQHLSPPIKRSFIDDALRRRLLRLYPIRRIDIPEIVDFQPWSGYPGSLIVIIGRRFLPERDNMVVTVGEEEALIISSEPTKIVAVTSLDTVSGPVRVAWRSNPDGYDEATRKFEILDFFSKGEQLDGPPISYHGLGAGWWSSNNRGGLYLRPMPDDIPKDGGGTTYPIPLGDEETYADGRPITANVLLIPCYSNDQTQPNPIEITNLRSNISEAVTFYDQVCTSHIERKSIMLMYYRQVMVNSRLNQGFWVSLNYLTIEITTMRPVQHRQIIITLNPRLCINFSLNV